MLAVVVRVERLNVQSNWGVSGIRAAGTTPHFRIGANRPESSICLLEMKRIRMAVFLVPMTMIKFQCGLRVGFM